MTDIRSVPIFPGDIRALRLAIEDCQGADYRSVRSALAQIIERYEEACICPRPHDLFFHTPPCPKAHKPPNE